jgi:hypothetical protein
VPNVTASVPDSDFASVIREVTEKLNESRMLYPNDKWSALQVADQAAKTIERLQERIMASMSEDEEA